MTRRNNITDPRITPISRDCDTRVRFVGYKEPYIKLHGLHNFKHELTLTHFRTINIIEQITLAHIASKSVGTACMRVTESNERTLTITCYISTEL